MAEANGGSRRVEFLKGMMMKHLEAKVNQASGYIQTGDIENPRICSKVCSSLGSSIDAAIAMNEVPSSSHLLQLALIVKEVYRCKTDLLQPSLMLLMLSIKAACRIGWFPNEDKNDFLLMAQEISFGFSDTDKMNVEPSNAHSYVSNIISRFYPNMKVGSILTSFDVKAGYGTYVADFHISRGILPRPCQNLWLLVARMDNMDTAACIVSPPNVDFLVNGSGVTRRTRNDMGKVPQFPSNVSKMIKYGVNLLQVLGEFDGQYIIVLAFMNLISSPDPPQLQDYVNPMSGDSDCDAIEMPSRVSLNCPISQHHIKIPVKGHLCKHPQCFDYKYFMELNSRWPTWKCPLCNKPVCNLDIRIDQTLLKILNEVAEDVNDVIISADGSWSASDMATTKTNINSISMTQNNHGNLISVDANDTIYNSETSMDPPLRQYGQSQVTTPPSIREIRHHLNPVTLTTTVTQATKPNHSPTQAQAHQVRTDGPTVGTTKEAQSTTLSASGRMRGSLRGNELAAAKLQFLAPPRQPARVNKPWSRPTTTHPIHLLMQQPPNNSTGNNTPNGSATDPPGSLPSNI